ncbi:MAG TPA: DUF433 domain-containing protein [Rubrobacteraceae bacterium]
MVNTLDHNHDLFTRPLYSYAEADRLAGVPRGTSNRWVKGYKYRNDWGERVTQPPMTAGPEDKTEGGVSFFDLVSIKAIDSLRELGFSTRKIREVVRYCREELRVAYPFATERFKTDRRRIYMRAGDGHLWEVLGGQKGAQAWDQILDPFLEDLEYQNELARRWWPLGKEDQRVVVDPDYGFGLPVIMGSGVRTEIIAEQIEAGDTVDQVSYDFNVTPEQIDAALELEGQLAA